MFGLFKKKIKNAIDKAEEVPVEEVEEVIETSKSEEKKGFFKKVSDKVTQKKVGEKQFEKIFWNIELVLLESNVAMDVVEKIKKDMKQKLVDQPFKGKLEKVIKESLGESLREVLELEPFDLVDLVREKKEKPFVVLFVGVNGSGKTTTIGKVGNYLKENGLKCLFCASDTFRSAAIEQLEYHGKKLGVEVVKQSYGADPAAVAYDAISHAKSKGLDVVLIDTAGRQQSNINLMRELEKVYKVSKPDLTFFIGESIAGSDVVTQVIEFGKAVKIDGVILSKFDVDDKGGAALSVSYVSNKPVIFLGVGQNYKDLEVFDKEKIIGNLGL